MNVCTVTPTEPDTACRLSNASIVPVSDLIRGTTGSETGPKNVRHYTQFIREDSRQIDRQTDSETDSLTECLDDS